MSDAVIAGRSARAATSKQAASRAECLPSSQVSELDSAISVVRLRVCKRESQSWPLLCMRHNFCPTRETFWSHGSESLTTAREADLALLSLPVGFY